MLMIYWTGIRRSILGQTHTTIATSIHPARFLGKLRYVSALNVRLRVRLNLTRMTRRLALEIRRLADLTIKAFWVGFPQEHGQEHQEAHVIVSEILTGQWGRQGIPVPRQSHPLIFHKSTSTRAASACGGSIGMVWISTNTLNRHLTFKLSTTQ